MNLSVISKYLTPHRVLDIGANIGQFHLLTKEYFPDSYIFSIEASEECEPYLQKITDNYLISLLTRDNAEYNFYSRKDAGTGTGNSIYKELTSFYSDTNVKVLKKPGIRLDDLFTEDSVFDLIKIDTQGSELDIISGGLGLCSRAKAILLEVSLLPYNNGAPLIYEVISFMNGINYKETEILGETYHPETGELIHHDILFINTNAELYT